VLTISLPLVFGFFEQATSGLMPISTLLHGSKQAGKCVTTRTCFRGWWTGRLTAKIRDVSL
jgi:hypothetical protein